MWDSHITYMSPATSGSPEPQPWEPAAGSHPTGKSESESRVWIPPDLDTLKWTVGLQRATRGALVPVAFASLWIFWVPP